jgi:hypothetical protein
MVLHEVILLNRTVNYSSIGFDYAGMRLVDEWMIGLQRF